MTAKIQKLIRSNQTCYYEVYCDECRYNSRNTMEARELTEVEATELAQWHDECEH